MGMFDTFWGEYICSQCGRKICFEEQIKNFACKLDDFKLGDYVDKANRNYFYNFTYECPHCHGETDLSIGIRRGQYVGVYLAKDAENMNPEDLDNIEENLQRKLDYQRKCELAYGDEDAEKNASELVALKVGDTLEVLKTRWKILAVYFEKPKKNEKELITVLYRPTVVYRAVSEKEGLYRVITSVVNTFTRLHYYQVFEDKIEQLSWPERMKEENKNRYITQVDCELIPITGGEVVWQSTYGSINDKG